MMDNEEITTMLSTEELNTQNQSELTDTLYQLRLEYARDLKRRELPVSKFTKFTSMFMKKSKRSEIEANAANAAWHEVEQRLPRLKNAEIHLLQAYLTDVRTGTTSLGSVLEPLLLLCERKRQRELFEKNK